MYPYLTGSASWFILTLLTQVFGVRGQYGDLLIAPKLSAEQFRSGHKISLTRVFAGRYLKINFSNSKRTCPEKCSILKAFLNRQPLSLKKLSNILIKRDIILRLPRNRLNRVDVTLGE